MYNSIIGISIYAFCIITNRLIDNMDDKMILLCTTLLQVHTYKNYDKGVKRYGIQPKKSKDI